MRQERGGTQLGKEVPENRTIGFTADEVSEIIAGALEAGLPQGEG
ncbi:hypothetical protein [Thalassobaculum sp.]